MKRIDQKKIKDQTAVQYIQIMQLLTEPNARILDPNNIRIAWGTVNAMEKTLERMANMATKSINANTVHKKVLLM